MASRILLRPLTNTFTSTLLVSSVLAAPLLLQPYRRPLLLDSATVSPLSSKDWSYSRYQRDAQVPVTKNGRVNPAVFKQISAGSILGLIGGVAVSVFSKPLALIIGLLVFGLQAVESSGLHIIPYNSMQRYVKSINLRSAVLDNVAFKLSFGATFALAAFAEF
ncbi:hypothetical protein H2201_004863 [Coniosporium apollinis]|uniref:FUN14 family protein n=2 Tax=Coniosporium TaxID=2810619 RepID=A0ABQ9NUR1_9PEZI|nr:hypothetical protein H2199_004581 [Cladosporium sp. JES 115]KAJ9664999.1 hypothetical protein H2201_004863 [Coniosporium apollinis]